MCVIIRFAENVQRALFVREAVRREAKLCSYLDPEISKDKIRFKEHLKELKRQYSTYPVEILRAKIGAMKKIANERDEKIRLIVAKSKHMGLSGPGVAKSHLKKTSLESLDLKIEQFRSGAL